ncbi:SCO2400 family protein, partial [Streptomyces griseoruber]|uniref:SCO2400 family protein n=1 Tax=Streptomyces griseoruber TaxID=1943 RepID=UPI000ABB34F8
MDYCHPCRRHLNGALTCPGCGASADPLRAYPRDVYTPEPRPGASDGPGDHDTPGGGGHVGHEAQGDGREAPEADGDESRGRAARRRGQGRGGRRGGGDAAGAGPADASDASRRDRKAAVHRRRRRRAVLITAGFVLAPG